ncbi:MAG: type II toxin-antitoxin system HicA family toxin [Verrucomicrobia bacterium]|nr:type II toxin-antitoxin system HicA family toxin [Verrucomicrobiota bacterium]
MLDGSRNVRFEEVCRLAEAFGFRRDRVIGSHHIYRQAQGLMLNLQPDRNGQAKFCQVRQLLELVEQNGLRLRD